MPKRPEIMALRRQVAREIVRALGPMGEYFIAPGVGIRTPRAVELAHGNVNRCSLDWLIDRVYRLGGTVTLTVAVEPAKRSLRPRAAASP